MAPPDKELIIRSRQGDERAFQLLVERYEAKVAATVIGMLGRGPEAEDVGQETFIRLYRSLDRFRGDSSLGTYVTRIAINQSLKALEKRRTWRQRFFSPRSNEDFVPEAVAERDTTLEEGERREFIDRALQSLSPDHRAVVVLRMMEEYSTRETAEILGMPQGTVMSRLKRAIDLLRENVGTYS